MLTNLRAQELLAEKARLIESIEKSQETLQQWKSKRNYIVFSSDSSDEEIDRRPTKVLAKKPPGLNELQNNLEKLETRQYASEELTGLHIESFDIKMLPRPPEDIKLTKEQQQLECDWHIYSAKCQLGLVPFNITFVLQTPRANITNPPYRRCFHHVDISLSKRQHALEWSRAREQYATSQVDESEGRTPSFEISALRAYVDCVRSRRDTLLEICNQYQEKGVMNLEPLAGGGHKITGPESLFQLEWTIICSDHRHNKFIHVFQIDLKELNEEFITEVHKIFVKLSDEKCTSLMRIKLLSELMDICLSVDVDVSNESSNRVSSTSELTRPTSKDNPKLHANKEDTDAGKKVQRNNKVKKGGKGKRRERNSSINSQDTVKL